MNEYRFRMYSPLCSMSYGKLNNQFNQPNLCSELSRHITAYLIQNRRTAQRSPDHLSPTNDSQTTKQHISLSHGRFKSWRTRSYLFAANAIRMIFGFDFSCLTCLSAPIKCSAHTNSRRLVRFLFDVDVRLLNAAVVLRKVATADILCGMIHRPPLTKHDSSCMHTDQLHYHWQCPRWRSPRPIQPAARIVAPHRSARRCWTTFPLLACPGCQTTVAAARRPVLAGNRRSGRPPLRWPLPTQQPVRRWISSAEMSDISSINVGQHECEYIKFGLTISFAKTTGSSLDNNCSSTHKFNDGFLHIYTRWCIADASWPILWLLLLCT